MKPLILKLLFINLTFFTFFLSNLNAKTTYVDNADDICYEKPTPSGFMCINMGICSGGLGCKNTYPLKNIGSSTLSNVEAIYDESGLGGSFSSDCGVNPSGTCTSKSNINMGPFGMLGKTTVFDLANSIPPDDNSNSIWASNFAGMSCFNGANLYATYTKNGQQYRGVVQACPTATQESNGDRDFELRHQENITGDVKVIGNTVLCEHNSHGQCEESKDGLSNDQVDLQKAPISSSTLTIPDGAVVVYARIYWQGRIKAQYKKDYKQWTNKQKNLAKVIEIKKGNSGAYKKLTADVADFSSTDYINIYSASADALPAVTGSGTYYVDPSSFYTNTGETSDADPSDGLGNYGAWSLVVVYQDNNSTTTRNISIFDGYKKVTSSSGNINVSVSGFLTPKVNPVDSKTYVFAGEGDKYLKNTGDVVKMSGIRRPTSPMATLGTFDSRIDVPATRVPDLINNNGIDIQYYDVGTTSGARNIIKTGETGAKFQFTSDQDTYFPSLIVFSTQIYAPRLCYDYTYGQNGYYITAPSTKPTEIEGSFSPTRPIDVKLYFKNLENSDIELNDLQVHIYNIDTSKVTYKRDSTAVTVPGGLQQDPISDAGRDVGNDHNYNIPIGHLGSLQYFYTYYSLNHLGSDINTTIHARLTYKYSVKIDGQSTNITGIGTSDIADMNPCQGSSAYTPVPGRFNVVHKSQKNSSLSSDYYFNLPTQVVKRYTDNYLMQSLDPDDLNTTKGATGVIGLEMVDMSGFHYATATCTDHNATTINNHKIWVIFDNNTTKYIGIKKADLQNNLFFNRASKNVAFRLSYNPSAINSSRVNLKENSSKLFEITNYDQLAGQECDASFGTSKKIDTYCGSEGKGSSNNGMDSSELSQCFSCIFGTEIKNECSRDNFAIRPEAFLLQLKDQNQTTSSNLLNINGTGANNDINLAAGYSYRLDINATNHQDNNPSKGYNAAFDNNQSNTAMQLQYKWTPRQAINSNACNDTTNKIIEGGFNNGFLDHNSSVSQVGEYKLSAVDKEWTAVDYKYIQHHQNNKYFNSAANADCIQNSANVVSSTHYQLNGCQISSSHKNVDTGFIYTDKNVTFHPYAFDLNAVNPTVGLTDDANVTDAYIYMADISKNSDENMSFHLNGIISAVGADSAATTNFVNGCYAQPLQLNIKVSDINYSIAYKYRLHILDENSTQIREEVKDLNNSQKKELNKISLPNSDFIKSAQGSVNTILNLNYDRKVNKAVNPELITFKTYKVACSTPANCAYTADLNLSNAAEGKKDLNYKIKHYYGKAHALRQRYFGADGNVSIYYEVYCDLANDGNKSLLQDKFNSKYSDDPRWFINTKHKTARDGRVNSINQRGFPLGSGNVQATTIDAQTLTKALLKYSTASTNGYPYITTMEINASNWLIYNRYNKNAKKNEFEVEFINSSAGWAGEHETNSTTKKNAADITNRRLMW
ncbi:hypothetical protein [Sulfurimonas sp.]|uniref:hypothetical protein n=1 Tax=Sulfurimonas sp. TaxID=2022749 RepID=UPI00260E7A1D|nr:hypothetical protein [Sulfurimonas sp.]